MVPERKKWNNQRRRSDKDTDMLMFAGLKEVSRAFLIDVLMARNASKDFKICRFVIVTDGRTEEQAAVCAVFDHIVEARSFGPTDGRIEKKNICAKFKLLVLQSI
jgi:hypothetical protein